MLNLYMYLSRFGASLNASGVTDTLLRAAAVATAEQLLECDAILRDSSRQSREARRLSRILDAAAHELGRRKPPRVWPTSRRLEVVEAVRRGLQLVSQIAGATANGALSGEEWLERALTLAGGDLRLWDVRRDRDGGS